jgi:hypothetical protein
MNKKQMLNRKENGKKNEEKNAKREANSQIRKNKKM